MRRVAVLNSYNLPGVDARDTLRIRSFLQGLAGEGLHEGRDFELILVNHEEPELTAAAARELAASGVDLFHAIGTPNAAAAARASAEIPIVYYGAHPEGICDEICSAANVTGKIFSLPFTSGYKQFRFLRRFLPHVQVVWTPFFESTVFVRPEMKALHRAARDRAGRRVWLTGGEGPVGFETLAGLAYIVGVRYRELVYSTAEELAAACAEIDPTRGVLMPYNESFHCPGALEVIVRKTREMALPVIYNNNAQVTVLGLLSGIAADWALLGRQSGQAAGRVLQGAHPRELGRELHTDQVAWINLQVAESLGLDLSEDVLDYFDRRVPGPGAVLCM